jgi:hypothetical protein
VPLNTSEPPLGRGGWSTMDVAARRGPTMRFSDPSSLSSCPRDECRGDVRRGSLGLPVKAESSGGDGGRVEPHPHSK